MTLLGPILVATVVFNVATVCLLVVITVGAAIGISLIKLLSITLSPLTLVGLLIATAIVLIARDGTTSALVSPGIPSIPPYPYP